MTYNIERLGMMAGYISGIGTEQARNEATSLQGILEHIVNFFTFGYVQSNLNKQYDLLVKEIAVALDQSSPSGVTIPPTLSVDFNGHTLTFTLPQENCAGPNVVTIEVRNGKNGTTYSVDKDMFLRISTGLLICQRADLPYTLITLNNEGVLDLSNADLSGSDLGNADLGYVDLSNANLCGANLAGANLAGARLDGTLAYGANLKGANLKGVFKPGVNLMNFRGTNLERADLGDLARTDPLLTLPTAWNQNTLNLYFDHLTNLSGNSLLTTLKSIDKRHADIKVRMALEIRQSLLGVDVSDISNALWDFLGRDPDTGYAGEADIRHWLPEGSYRS